MDTVIISVKDKTLRRKRRKSSKESKGGMSDKEITEKSELWSNSSGTLTIR